MGWIKVTIKELTDLIMKQAKEKGWGTSEEEINVGEKIALTHAQLSSAFEGYRNNKMTGEWSFEDEIAGTIQRILHLCGCLGVDVEEAIQQKMKDNESRDWEWDKLNRKRS